MAPKTMLRTALTLLGVLVLVSTLTLAAVSASDGTEPRDWPNSLDEARRVLAAPFDRLRGAIVAVHGRKSEPGGLVMRAEKFGNRLTLELSPQLPPGLRLEGRIRPESAPDSPQGFSAAELNGHVDLRLAEALDVSVNLVGAKGEVLESLYLTDGHYTGFDDSSLGGQSQSSIRINQACERQRESSIMATPLSGCARLEGTVERYGVIARTLETSAGPLDMSRYQSIGLRYRSNQSLLMCLESRRRQGDSQPCVQLPPQSSAQWVQLSREDFVLRGGDVAAVNLDDVEGISWNVWNPTPGAGPMPVSMQVESVTLYESRPASAMTPGPGDWVRGGCSQTTPLSFSGALLLLLVLALIRHRTGPAVTGG